MDRGSPAAEPNPGPAPTERLYYADSYLRVFEAQVLEVRPRGQGYAVVLDRTVFYPTSGGQPHDRGTLGAAAVLDVQDEGERIVHVTDAPVAGVVRGEIDWPRRFDHMQQHTGQHILSQAALRVCGAQTTSVHFGTEACTLDLDRPDLTDETAAQIEDLANAVVVEDRPVSVRFVDESQVPTLGLRRPAKRRGEIRVVEVAEFDRSSCGGTHVRRTGEIGLIKITGWERYKGGVRVAFLCGGRALRDYRWKHTLLRDVAASLSVADREVKEAVGRLGAALRERERALQETLTRLLTREAADYLAQASGSPKIVAAVLDRPPDEAAALAGRIIAAGEAAVALAARGRLVVARSPSVAVDAAAILRAVLEPLGGKGGGRPEFARGVLPAESMEAAVEAARAALRQALHA